MRINIAIVEDDLQTREGLKIMIESFDEIYCQGIFEDADAFISSFKHLEVDVVLMDINLPGCSGIECVEQLKEKKPGVQFLMCTHLKDDDKIFSALKAGATGYILKNITAEKLTIAIKEIYNGGSPMSPEIARKVTEAFAIDRKSTEQIKLLTKREREVIELLAFGYPYKIVADRLSLKTDTIRAYIRGIYSKLQVHNKTEAINKLHYKMNNGV